MPPSYEAIMEQIKSIKSDTAEIRAELSEHIKAQNEYMVAEADRRGTNRSQIDRAHERIDELSVSRLAMEQRITANEKLIASLLLQARLVGWVATAFGVSLIGLIVSLITGQATIIFK